MTSSTTEQEMKNLDTRMPLAVFTAAVLVTLTGCLGVANATLGAFDSTEPELVDIPVFDCPPGQHDGGLGKCIDEESCADDFNLSLEGGFCVRFELLASVPDLEHPVSEHTAVFDGDDSIVVVGGFDPETAGDPVLGIQIRTYSLASNTWRLGPTFESFGHRSLLFEGGVLVVGGSDGTTTTDRVASISIEDSSVSLLSAMTQAREGHTLTLLSDGRVVVIGGGIFLNGIDNPALSSIEVFDGQQWEMVEVALPEARAYHATTLLDDGRLLVTGGTAVVSLRGDPVATAWIIDIDDATVENVGPMNAPRADHTASLLGNGSVVVVDGRGLNSLAQSNVDLFDGGRFRAVVSNGQGLLAQTASTLPGGRTVLTGGVSTSLIPSGVVRLVDDAGAFFNIVSLLEQARGAHPAVVVGGNSFVLVGGGGGQPFLSPATSSMVKITIGR